MWAIALRTMGDPEEAADALQDALISAFRRAGSFRGEAAVTTWLHRIVVNACLDRIRRRTVRPTAPLVGQALPDPTGDREVRLDVAAALARIPAEQRAALVLIDMQGYSVEKPQRSRCAGRDGQSRCARGRPGCCRISPAAPGSCPDCSDCSAGGPRSRLSRLSERNLRIDDAVNLRCATAASWSGGERAGERG
jgi:RNA polymerase sigma-70 factor (ECF subfamily)